MGTFAGFYGDQTIKEELKEEYIKNVLKVLTYGGMMQFENVSMFNCEISLIKPPTANNEGSVNFYYNYFGDEAWETAGLNTNTGRFYTNKIGWGEFCDVCLAVYILTEFYTEEFGITELNGDLIDGKEIIGWLNYVLDKDFTNIRATDAFKIMETCPELYKDNIYEIVFGCTEFGAVNLGALVTYLYLNKDKNGIWNEVKEEFENPSEDGKNFNLPLLIKKNNEYIDKLKEKGMEYSDLIDFAMDAEKGLATLDKESDEYGYCLISLFLPRKTLLALLCEKYSENFWDEYKKYKEQIKNKVDELWAGDISLLKPITKIKTSKYLDVPDTALCFRWSKAEENYHKSDDDFAYFWKKDCDLEFSEEFKSWCKTLKEDYIKIKEDLSEFNSVQNFMSSLMFSLHFANKRYKRIFAFQEMFYDFISNSYKEEFQAALLLFNKVIDDNLEVGSVIEDVRDWDIADKNLTFNKGRLNVKRFLAIMANKELRFEIFGF